MSLSVNELKCGFSGKSIEVRVSNPGTSYESFRYECVYSLSGGGEKAVSGSAALDPGKSSVVATEVADRPISGVVAKSIW